MAARIVLVRHGPSAHAERFWAIDRAGLHDWRVAYDDAGVLAAAQPPASLTRIASTAAHVLASDLRRAIESAERLAPQRQIRVSELLREAPLPIPNWPTRLPLPVWGLFVYLTWNYGMLRGADALESHRTRAASAADWLSGLVSDGSTAVAVTHGVFRRLLADQLVNRGWSGESRRGGYRHWSAWTFSGPSRIRESE